MTSKYKTKKIIEKQNTQQMECAIYIIHNHLLCSEIICNYTLAIYSKNYAINFQL